MKSVFVFVLVVVTVTLEADERPLVPLVVVRMTLFAFTGLLTIVRLALEAVDIASFLESTDMFRETTPLVFLGVEVVCTVLTVAGTDVCF